MLANSTSGRQVSRSAFSLLRMNKNCIRFFLACLMLTGIGIVAGVAQTVMTDKDDYQPGDTLIITGSGWKPGETVQLHIEEFPTLCVSGHNLYTVVDLKGNIYDKQFVFKQSHLGLAFTLDAIGQTSGLAAQTNFTDGNPPVAYQMSSGNYSESFGDITNWSNSFASGVGAAPWGSVAMNTSGTVGDGVKISNATGTFVTGTSGGVQKGIGNIQLLSTSTANSCAIDLYLDFTGRNAGFISFDLATVFNSTGDRDSKLKIFYSLNGTSWTEITGPNLPYTARNNVPGSATINVSLPAALNNSANVVLRFYEYSTTGGATPSGSQPKISIDNIVVTSTSTGPVAPACATTSIVPSNNSSGISITGTNLSWAPVSGATNYDVYFGTDVDPTNLVITQQGNSFLLGTLQYSTTYYWKVIPKNSIGDAMGCTVFRFTTVPAPPANDDCINAIQVTPGFNCVTTSGTTQNATQQFAPTSCTGSTSSKANDVWYKFVADGISNYSIQATTGSMTDLVIGLYSSCSTGSLISCRDNEVSGTEILNAGVLAAGTYLYRIYGYNNASGSFTTCVTKICPTFPAISIANQNRCGDGLVTFSVNNPGGSYSVEWSNDGINVDNTISGFTYTKSVAVGTPVIVYVRFSVSADCKSSWVSAVGTAGTFSTLNTILSENFDASSSFPNGWTSSNTTNGWLVSSASSSSSYPDVSGNNNALFAGTGSNGVKHTLTYNNNLSTVGYSGLSIIWGGRGTSSFDSEIVFEWSSNGTTWNPVSYSYSNNSNSWSLVNEGNPIPLPTAALGIANLRLRWSSTTGNTGNYRIDDVKLYAVQATGASITTTDNCDGTVTLSSSGGAGYTWTPGGATSRSIIVNATGNYSVTVTGATYGCTSTASTAVSVLPVPIVATANVTSPKCFGESGTVVIAATGGDGVYTGTGTFTVAAGANYNYTVTDSKGCISNVISGAMPAPTQVVASSQFNPILCIGSTTLVTVSATGGTGSYTGAGTFTKPAGLYNFTVIDENGCSAMTSATITEPSEIIINEVITNVSCNGKTDGSVNLSISGGTPSAKLLVSENFDGLSSTGSPASWTNNSTITNWYASVSGSTPSSYLVGTGTNTAGAIYSFGVAGVNALSDRALGSIASGSTNDILGAWKISNTTTQTLTTITVNYTGEQWRNGGNTTAQSLNFDYQVNASSITAGSWTSVPALNFTSLKNTSAASELDGNDPSNRSLKTATFSISLPPGQAIWLRWTDVNDAGNDHGLAIDDLSAELTAGSGNVAPYTYSWSSGATTQNLSSVGAGTYTVTVTDDNNCSKQKTVTVTQPDPITTSESATACDSYTWPLNGQVYTTTGTYTYVFQNANGCNVTASLVLTINKSTTSEASVTACDQYVWHGVTYTMSGDYTYSSTNAAGCPHVETLHLTINKSTTSEASVTACDQYVWHDVTYTMSGDYTYSSTNAAGCPHVETLHLTINKSTSSEASVTACDQYVWHDVTYTMGGDYTYSSTNAAGCPHVETLHLTINKSTSSEASVTACDQYVWHDVTYTMDGDYTYSSTNAAGCPHVETLHLTINKSTTSEASVTACDQYVWHGVTYTMGGDYTYGSTNAAGCPHVEALHLTINKSTSHTTTITVCTSYTWSGPLGDNQTYTEAGTYTHTSTNADGCTHTEKLILSINPPIVFSATAHQPKCAGDKGSVTLGTPAGGTGAIHFNGTPTTNLAPGTYTYTAIDELGCASSVSVVIDPVPAALVASASAGTISCFGGTATVLVSANGGTLPYSGTGSFVVGAGPYAYPVTDGNGCVSTASGNISQPNALSIVCSNSNPNLYYGYINGQSTIIKGSPIGGKAPYTVSITMNRKLVCDSVTASGDEFWTPSGGASSNNICSTVNSAPVSTLSGIAETGSYSLEATLMKNATFTITVTDANGCTATCSTFVKAEDVRCFSGNSGNAKIAICHKTGSTKNPCTAICVDQSALAEHLAHGDYMGSCTPNCVAPAIVAAAATTVEHHDLDEHATKLELKVMNNPAFNGSAFKLRVLSNNQQELIHLKVMDMNGRPVETKNGIRAGQTIEIGRSYIGGMYVVEAIQAGQRVVVKLIRQ